MKSKIWIILLAFYFVGCNDFLEESSQDEVRPSTVDDMEQLLLGEVYMDRMDVIYNGTEILRTINNVMVFLKIGTGMFWKEIVICLPGRRICLMKVEEEIIYLSGRNLTNGLKGAM